jgi:hypothetical protein
MLSRPSNWKNSIFPCRDDAGRESIINSESPDVLTAPVTAGGMRNGCA